MCPGQAPFWYSFAENADTIRKGQITSLEKKSPPQFSARMARTALIFCMQIAGIHFPCTRWGFFVVDNDFGRNCRFTYFFTIFAFKIDVFSGTDDKTAQNGCAEKKLEEISPLEQYVKNLQHALCFAKKKF